MTTPLTLGDVRARIERRIRGCGEDEEKLSAPAYRELRASIQDRRAELTRVLAMLDRVQPEDAALCAVVKAAQELRKWDDDQAKRELFDALIALDRVQSDGEIAERKSIMNKDVIEDEIVVRAEPQSSIRFVPPAREVLRLWPDGTSQYRSDDLREAAAIFWQSGRPDESGAVEALFAPGDGKRPGFRIHRNGSIEYFDGYRPDDKTRHALETIASLRPVVSQEGEGKSAP